MTPTRTKKAGKRWKVWAAISSEGYLPEIYFYRDSASASIKVKNVASYWRVSRVEITEIKPTRKKKR